MLCGANCIIAASASAEPEHRSELSTIVTAIGRANVTQMWNPRQRRGSLRRRTACKFPRLAPVTRLSRTIRRRQHEVHRLDEGIVLRQARRSQQSTQCGGL